MDRYFSCRVRDFINALVETNPEILQIHSKLRKLIFRCDKATIFVKKPQPASKYKKGIKWHRRRIRRAMIDILRS